MTASVLTSVSEAKHPKYFNILNQNKLLLKQLLNIQTRREGQRERDREADRQVSWRAALAVTDEILTVLQLLLRLLVFIKYGFEV